MATGDVSYNATTLGDLAAGASAPQQYAFRLPDGPAGVGQIQIMVTADVNDAVSTAQGDPSKTSTITEASTLGNYADLIVGPDSLVATPANPLSSGTVTVIWNDENQGDAAVNAGFNDAVLVQKVNSGGSLTTVTTGTVSGDATLAAGATSARQQFSFTLPDGAAGVGNFLITVTTDSGQTVKEYDSSGNTAYGNNSSSVTTTSALGNYADLIVAPGSMATTPTNPLSSGTVTVTWNDENQGDGPVNAAFNDAILVQKVNSGGSLTTIATGTVSGGASLVAGATSTQQHLSFTLPDGPAGVGNFLITVTTDSGQTVKEYDDNGNTAYGNNSSSITTTSTLGNYADLMVAPGSLATTPTSPLSSGSVTVTWNDQNQGDAAVSAAFNDSVLVQKVNSGGSLTTIATGTVSGNASLAAGATSAQQQFSFTLPAGPAGAGNFLITVTTDSGQTVKEYDSNGNTAYGNNSASITTTSTLGNYADLVVASGPLAVTPASPQSGGSATVTWADKNQGDGAVNAAFSDYVLVQKVVGSTDTTIASGYVSGNATLAAGAISGTQSFPFTLPDGAPGVGNLVVTVTTDSGQTVKEYDSSGNPGYGNNSSSITTTSTLGNYADLIVAPDSLVATPANPLSSGTVTVIWNDQNQGDAAVNAAFNDAVLVQKVNSGGSLTTIATGTVGGDATLAAGATSPAAVLLHPPRWRGGRRQLPDHGDHR